MVQSHRFIRALSPSFRPSPTRRAPTARSPRFQSFNRRSGSSAGRDAVRVGLKPHTDFVKDRGTKTISLALSLAPRWTWHEKTSPQKQAALVVIIGGNPATPPVVGQEEVVGPAEGDMICGTIPTTYTPPPNSATPPAPPSPPTP